MMGKPVVAGTRITVEHILDKLAAGESVEELLAAHKRLTEEGIRAALAFAAEALRAEPIIKTQLEKLGRVNKSLFSVGSCQPRTHLVASGIASLEDLHWYVEHGAVGVICGRFIDRNGDHVTGPLDQRMIGIDPGQLQKVDTGIMVFSGLHKLEAALAAIRGGYTTHLIVDERSGTELLKLADKSETNPNTQ